MGRAFDRALLALPLAAVGGVWLATASRHVLGGDNGELATVAVTGGAGHPPGYPLVAMYLHAMRWLPAVSPSHAAALANALLAIAALLVLARACLAWGASAGASAIACVAWGLAPTTWALATQAEVFAANALFTACILWLASPEAPLPAGRRAVALALVAGLALANQYTIVTVAPLGLYAFVRAVRAAKGRAGVIAASAGALVVGGLPYAFLFAAAPHACDPASWSWGDVHDGSSLIAYLSRSDYPASGLATAAHVSAQLGHIALGMVGLPVVALVGLGAWAARRRARGVGGYTWGTLAPWAALGISVLCAGPLFMTRFNIPLGGAGGAVAERFDLLPMTLLVPCIARGLDELAARYLAAPVVAGSLVAAFFVALVARGLTPLHAHQRTGVELYAENAFVAAPPRAVILGTGDARLGSFLYARYALGERPDVTFVNARLLLTPWYHARIARALGVDLPEVKDHSLDVAALFAALLTSGRPVFVTDWFSPKVLDRLPTYPVGPLVRVLQSMDQMPAPEDVERMNLEVATKLTGEDLPLEGPEPWSDALAEDYARPWEALAKIFAARGDEARSRENARRADEARGGEWR